jgi:4-alpha-glucanotransferase
MIEARPIGLLQMIDKGERDNKVLAVPSSDPLFRDYHVIGDLPQHFLRETAHFFSIYKDLEHAEVEILGWLDDISPEEKAFAEKYLAINREEGWCWGMLRGGMSSAAGLYIAQMQDLLEKPGECRMNTPGTGSGNWCWRMLPGECCPALAEKLLEYTKLYGRI